MCYGEGGGWLWGGGCAVGGRRVCYGEGELYERWRACWDGDEAKVCCGGMQGVLHVGGDGDGVLYGGGRVCCGEFVLRWRYNEDVLWAEGGCAVDRVGRVYRGGERRVCCG